MPKVTPNAKLAQQRIAKALGFKLTADGTLTRVSDGVVIGNIGASNIERLAFLADLARRGYGRKTGGPRHDVKLAAKWSGKLPLNGLSGWEQHALEWLQL